MSKASAQKQLAKHESHDDSLHMVRYDAMCHAIAEAHRVDEVKDIRDRAEALRAYAKQANNRDAEVQFAEIKVRAEIKAGEILIDMAAKGERKTRGGDQKSNFHDGSLILSDLDISDKESHRYQKAAEAPRAKVEEAFREARKNQVPITSAQIRAMTKQPNFTQEQSIEHDRLWRVLRAMEQISEQDITPKEWLAALPDFIVPRFEGYLTSARPWIERLFTLWDTRK